LEIAKSFPATAIMCEFISHPYFTCVKIELLENKAEYAGIGENFED